MRNFSLITINRAPCQVGTSMRPLVERVNIGEQAVAAALSPRMFRNENDLEREPENRLLLGRGTIIVNKTRELSWVVLTAGFSRLRLTRWKYKKSDGSDLHCFESSS